MHFRLAASEYIINECQHSGCDRAWSSESVECRFNLLRFGGFEIEYFEARCLPYRDGRHIDTEVIVI